MGPVCRAALLAVAVVAIRSTLIFPNLGLCGRSWKPFTHHVDDEKKRIATNSVEGDSMMGNITLVLQALFPNIRCGARRGMRNACSPSREVRDNVVIEGGTLP
jgi:hypothetical protein